MQQILINQLNNKKNVRQKWELEEVIYPVSNYKITGHKLVRKYFNIISCVFQFKNRKLLLKIKTEIFIIIFTKF